MSDNPLVSVIIPVHNRYEQLTRSVESVLSQSFSDYELIIVDDGSDDSLVSYISALQISYPQKIHLISIANKGVSVARNTGIKRARGEYIAFLDSDDLWIKDKLDIQIEYMKSNEVSVCQTEEQWIRHEKRVNPMRKHKKRNGHIFFDCLPLCIVSPSAVVIRRDVFNQVGLFDENMPVVEDYDLWLRICLDYPIHLIPNQLIKKYGGHADQLSRRYWGMDRFRIYSMRKLLRQYNPKLNSFKKAALYWWISQKSSILSTGAIKRFKIQTYIYYWLLKTYYDIKWRMIDIG